MRCLLVFVICGAVYVNGLLPELNVYEECFELEEGGEKNTLLGHMEQVFKRIHGEKELAPEEEAVSNLLKFLGVEDKRIWQDELNERQQKLKGLMSSFWAYLRDLDALQQFFWKSWLVVDLRKKGDITLPVFCEMLLFSWGENKGVDKGLCQLSGVFSIFQTWKQCNMVGEACVNALLSFENLMEKKEEKKPEIETKIKETLVGEAGNVKVRQIVYGSEWAQGIIKHYVEGWWKAKTQKELHSLINRNGEVIS